MKYSATLTDTSGNVVNLTTDTDCVLANITLTGGTASSSGILYDVDSAYADNSVLRLKIPIQNSDNTALPEDLVGKKDHNLTITVYDYYMPVTMEEVTQAGNLFKGSIKAYAGSNSCSYTDEAIAQLRCTKEYMLFNTTQTLFMTGSAHRTGQTTTLSEQFNLAAYSDSTTD